MICIARTFGAPESVPAGQDRAQRVERPDALAQPPRDARDDVHHVAVGLDLHVARRPGRCRTRTRARRRCGRGRRASRARRAPSRRRAAPRRSAGPPRRSPPRGRVPAIGRVSMRPSRTVTSGSGRGAGDLEVAEVEEVHVRARVDRAQAAVDRERLDRHLRRPALATGRPGRRRRRGCTRRSARPSPRTARAACCSQLGACAVARGALARRGCGTRPGEPRGARRRSPRPRSRRSARASLVVVRVDVREDRDSCAEVVERDEHVGQHQRQVGQADRVGVRLAERLDRAHEVVAEQPTAPPANGGRSGSGAWR